MEMIPSPLSSMPMTGGAFATTGFDEAQRIAARSRSGEMLSDEELNEVGKKFEALLLHQMLSAMRKTIPENGLFGNTSASKTYWDMFDESVANSVAESGQTGIAQTIVEEMKRQQNEVAPPDEDPPLRPLDEAVPLAPFREEPKYHRLEPAGPQYFPLPSKGPHFQPIPGRSVGPIPKPGGAIDDRI